MTHRLNTNKQFMIGNGLLAFGVIAIVVIFIYLGMRGQRDQVEERYYTEIYSINLVKGFVGDSLTFYINDSILLHKRIAEEPFSFEVKRFDDQSALIIVDNLTEHMAVFDLSNKGGSVSLVKDKDGVKQLAQ